MDSAKNNALDKIPNCIIDQDGVFKYIQILIKSSTSNEKKYVVRGYSKYDYHAKNYSDFQRELKSLDVSKDVSTRCTGGGRIDVDKNNKSIFIYGYSQSMFKLIKYLGYGQPNHQISCDIIKESFPNYEVTWSNEGY